MTTVEVATALHCTRRHVVNLINRDELRCVRLPYPPQGGRGPGFAIRRRDLLEYLRKSASTLNYLDAHFTRHVLVVGGGLVWGTRLKGELAYDDGWKIHLVTDLFNAGAVAARVNPEAVIIDQSTLDERAALIVQTIRKLGCRLLIALLHEDFERPGDLQHIGFDLSIRQPASHADVAKQIVDRLGEAPFVQERTKRNGR